MLSHQGARILPVTNSTTLQTSEGSAGEKRQAESLTDYNDAFWAGDLDLGSKEETFLIDFDSESLTQLSRSVADFSSVAAGSSDLWVPSVSCTSIICSGKTKYNPASSATSARKPGAFSIAYGDGSTVSGPVYTDTVTVAGVTAHDQYFSAVNTLSPTFADEAEDGILGLAFPAISNIGQPPFFNMAKAQGAFKAGEFAFKLASSGAELYLGGTNPTQYSGPIEYHTVIGPGYWQIDNMTLVSGSRMVESGQQTIIDSGTTLIYGPPPLVAALYKTIPGSEPFDDQAGFYQFPCAFTPSDVGFNWGGKTWTLSANDLNIGQISLTMCIGAVVAQDLGLGDNVWLLGDR